MTFTPNTARSYVRIPRNNCLMEDSRQEVTVEAENYSNLSSNLFPGFAFLRLNPTISWVLGYIQLLYVSHKNCFPWLACPLGIILLC